jgi:hypothetical protein
MYTEDELENYNTYMDWVRQMIVGDTDYGENDITLGHIRKAPGGEWVFEYKLRKKRKTKTIVLIDYEGWQREQKREERDAKIDMLLEGLSKDHKQILIEGLKNINKL